MAGYYKVKAKKGLLVREGAALDTPEITTLDNGSSITCVEEKKVGDKVRLRLSAPVEGWASKKLTEFECAIGARPTGETKWLRKIAAPDGATKRVIFFSWTGNRGGYGSSHSFKEWPKGLGADFACYEVQLAGRGARMKDALEKDPKKLFRDLAKDLDKALFGGPPTIFLGFAFAAVIAAEVANRLREPPKLLVAVSAEGPAWAGRGATEMRALDAAGFEAMLEGKKGTDFILKGGDAMKKMYLPVVKADIELEERYAPPPAPLLACPVVAYVGKKPGKDFEQTTVAEADAALWLDATTDAARSRVTVFEDDWCVDVFASGRKKEEGDATSGTSCCTRTTAARSSATSRPSTSTPRPRPRPRPPATARSRRRHSPPDRPSRWPASPSGSTSSSTRPPSAA